VRTVRSVAELRAALAARRDAGQTVGLVPTMGAFHAGHLALMGAAREACDAVVVSLFVNPTQFGAGEDLDAYPRDEGRDAELAAEAGVDLLFAPPVGEIYPDGFATTVSVRGGIAEVLCGDPKRRGPGHFDGVATVVTKLLSIVAPDVAYFGQKDAQQVALIRRVVRDLDLPVRIEALPTVREPDGLALSSRNAYLTPAERERAIALHRALTAAERAVAAGETAAAPILAAARAELAAADIEPEYLELRAAGDLALADSVAGPTLLALAARVGRARLIDNTVLETVPPPAMASARAGAPGEGAPAQ